MEAAEYEECHIVSNEATIDSKADVCNDPKLCAHSCLVIGLPSAVTCQVQTLQDPLSITLVAYKL